MASGNFAAEQLCGVVVVGLLLDAARGLFNERISLLVLEQSAFQVFLAMYTQASNLI